MGTSNDSTPDDYNPFQAPSTPFEPIEVEGTPAELIRREHLSHEASAKSIGSLYVIGGIICLVAAIVPAFVLGAQRAAEVQSLAVLGGVGVVMCVLATGLYRLQSWARYAAGVFSGIGLLGFPIGTIINAYILYLLFSSKGAMVFSDEYHQVMAQTPHIKYKTSILVKILFVILLVVIGGMFVAMLLVG